MTSITIRSSRPCDVLIEPGLLDRAGELLRLYTEAEQAAVVCGDIVYPLYAERAVRALERAGFRVCVKTIPHGEEHKTLASYGDLLSFLCERDFDRRDLVVALGGGVTGDLAGFAAATYRRGCAFAQIPTTLLAAVDASVGGKCAVDLPGGKNQAGCFYPPLAVLCDPDLFATLPASELRCAAAEIVKYGVLFDRAFFDSLYRKDLLPCAGELVAACVGFKRSIVERDEFDRGERRLLNLGHSFGHAIERCSSYTLRHGEAVSIGLAMIARAAARRSLCSDATRDEIVSLLRFHALETECPFSVRELVESLARDKKREGDTLRLVVPREIGRCEILSVPFADAADWLRDGGAK